MLTITNVCKTFAPKTQLAKTVLQNFNLHLDKGDFVTVIGGNGAGKSTLFKAIYGAFLVDSGKIELNGKNITYLNPHKRAYYIGQLFQDPLRGTAPSMTVEENLAMAYMRGKGQTFKVGIGKANRQLFRQELAKLGMGLEDRLKAQVGLLSGGQRQALTLLMATIVTPDLLLLDEHTAALDPAAAAKMMELTKEIVAQRNITTLMITHNLANAFAYGNRTIMLEGGKVRHDWNAEERRQADLQEIIALY